MSQHDAWLIGLLSLALLVQGFSLLSSSRHADAEEAARQRPAARIALALGGLALLCCWLLASDGLVPAPELGILLVNGRARLAVPVALFVVVVAAAHVLDIARQRAQAEPGPPVRAPWVFTLIALPLAFLLSTFGLEAIPRLAGATNQSELSAVRIAQLLLGTLDPGSMYAYPVWSPFLLVMLASCMAAWLGFVLRARSLPPRLLLVALAWFILAICEQSGARATLHDLSDNALMVWSVVFVASGAGLCAFSAHVVLGAFARPRILRHLVAVAAGGIGVWSSWFLRDGFTFWASVPLVLSVVATVAALAKLVFTKKLKVVDIGAPGRWDDVAIIVTFVVATFLWGDLFCFGWLPSWLSLSILVVAIVLLVDLLSPRPLLRAARALMGLVTGVSSRALGVRRSFWGAVKLAVTASSLPGVAMRLVLLILGMTVAAELPYAGKTVINPFKTVGFPKDGDFGNLLADKVDNTLGSLAQDLSTDIATSPAGGGLAREGGAASTGGGSTGFKVVTSQGGSEVAASSETIPIGDYRVPIGLLLAPIRAPVRWLLGIRVIRGTAHLSESGLTAFATASDGAVWSSQIECGDAAAAPAGQEKLGGETASPALVDAVARLAETLALKMFTGSNRSTPALTRSPCALQSFRKGMVAWREFNTNPTDFGHLTDAIRHFRAAARLDPGFALAHYRLGMALRLDRQPGLAVNALKLAINADSDLLAAQTALAATLFDFERFHFDLPGTLDGQAQELNETRTARAVRAGQLWTSVLAASRATDQDAASALLGLCRLAQEKLPGPRDGEPATAPLAAYRAYNYCRQAQNHYGPLLARNPGDAELKQTMAQVLNTLGLALFSAGREVAAREPTEWHCFPGLTQLDRADTRLARQARRLFQSAYELTPEDPVLRCNAADAALAGDDNQPMSELRNNPEILLWHGNFWLAQAMRDQRPVDFRQAMNVFERAIELDPGNLDAMNGLAYSFYVWRFRFPDKAPPLGPGLEDAFRAEKSAREAARISLAERRAETRTYASTLAEVLLAQGRPHEAIEILERAIDVAPADGGADAPSGPASSADRWGKLAERVQRNHWHDDELVWDLGQAYIWAREQDGEERRMTSERRDLWAKSLIIYNEVRRKESALERPAYSRDFEPLSPLRSTLTCSSRPARRTLYGTWPLKPVFVTAGGRTGQLEAGVRPGTIQVAQTRSEYCHQELEVVNLPAGVRVRVWGAGLNHVFAAADAIMLSATPRDTHEVYFARLETDQGAAVSEGFALNTSAKCTLAKTRLGFHPPRGLYEFKLASKRSDGTGYDVQLPQGEAIGLQVVRPVTVANTADDPERRVPPFTELIQPPPGQGTIHLAIPADETWHIQARRLGDTDRALSLPDSLAGNLTADGAIVLELKRTIPAITSATALRKRKGTSAELAIEQNQRP